MKSSPLAKKFRFSICLLSAASLIAGCASSSKDIASASVSPLLYQHYTCDQLFLENARLQSKAVELGGRLDKAAENDKAITGVALILFWPAAFALGGNKGQEAEYSRIKGENDAIQQALVLRNCGAATAPATLAAMPPPVTAIQVPSAAGSPGALAAPSTPLPATAPTIPKSLVGTSFSFTDTDSLNGAARGTQRLVLTHEDGNSFEYNNGEYVTDRDGNLKRGTYSVSGSNLYRRGASVGQLWQAKLKSADGASSGDIIVTATGIGSIVLSSGATRPTLKTSIAGWVTGPSQRSYAAGVSNEKISGQIMFDVATGLPVEYQFDTRNNSFSVTRKLERVQ